MKGWVPSQIFLKKKKVNIYKTIFSKFSVIIRAFTVYDNENAELEFLTE